MTLPFKNLAESYQQARPLYPSSVIDLIRGELDKYCNDYSLIVDMGCGTGISTRQLFEASGLNFIGVDPDPEMIQVAIKNSPGEIDYLVSDALTFKPNFPVDVITMFASLHWFSDRASMSNLRSVLKNDGIVLAVNRIDDEFRNPIRNIAASYLETEMPDIKREFSHEEVFVRNGFSIVRSESIIDLELFDAEQLEQYVMSMSVYNYIAPKNRNDAIEKIKDALLNPDGICERKVIFKITVATPS